MLFFIEINKKANKLISTLLENHSKFWHFPPIFVQLKMTCLVTLFDRNLYFFKNSPNLPFWTLSENVARFACKVVK